MTYQLIYQSPYIRRTSDGATIPNDENNADYKRYLEWVQNGGTPLPAEEPTQEELDKIAEVNLADPIATAWFANQPGIVNFIRLTPAEQETELNTWFSGHSTQEILVIKALVIFASAVIKKHYLS